VQKTLFTYYRSIDHIETAYYIMFFVCGSAYISAWLIMQALTGKVKPVNS
jgi:ACS family hexuronate transporter-like MFS transporter